jgi:hypothetical protein
MIEEEIIIFFISHFLGLSNLIASDIEIDEIIDEIIGGLNSKKQI